MEEFLAKLFNLKKHGFELGGGEGIGFASNPKELDFFQMGFRVTDKGKKIDDWFGDEYLVVGTTEMCGDPVIVKTDEKNYPVYFMFHDDWDTLSVIESSFDKFIENITKIDEMVNAGVPRKKLEKFVNKLDKNGNSFGFYNNLDYDEED